MKLGLTRTYEGAGFDVVIGKVREVLAGEGFGVLTEIDVQATLQEKLGASLERYVILGACNPPLAHRALGATRQIGMLLPCNVVVREEVDDRSVTVVEALNPAVMSEVLPQDAEVSAVAEEATARLESALAALDKELA